MKNITRRNFMRLSGTAALLFASGALAGCSGAEQGTVVTEDGAIDVPIPDEDAAEADKYTPVGDFAVYPMTVETIQDSQEGYGWVRALYLVIRNNSGADYVLDKTKVTVWMDKKPGKLVALDGGYGSEDRELQSSVVLPKDEETTVCIYADDNDTDRVSSVRFVLRLGNSKARIWAW